MFLLGDVFLRNFFGTSTQYMILTNKRFPLLLISIQKTLWEWGIQRSSAKPTSSMFWSALLLGVSPSSLYGREQAWIGRSLKIEYKKTWISIMNKIPFHLWAPPNLAVKNLSSKNPISLKMLNSKAKVLMINRNF